MGKLVNLFGQTVSQQTASSIYQQTGTVYTDSGWVSTAFPERYGVSGTYTGSYGTPDLSVVMPSSGNASYQTQPSTSKDLSVVMPSGGTQAELDAINAQKAKAEETKARQEAAIAKSEEARQKLIIGGAYVETPIKSYAEFVTAKEKGLVFETKEGVKAYAFNPNAPILAMPYGQKAIRDYFGGIEESKQPAMSYAMQVRETNKQIASYNAAIDIENRKTFGENAPYIKQMFETKFEKPTTTEGFFQKFVSPIGKETAEFFGIRGEEAATGAYKAIIPPSLFTELLLPKKTVIAAGRPIGEILPAAAPFPFGQIYMGITALGAETPQEAAFGIATGVTFSVLGKIPSIVTGAAISFAPEAAKKALSIGGKISEQITEKAIMPAVGGYFGASMLSDLSQSYAAGEAAFEKQTQRMTSQLGAMGLGYSFAGKGAGAFKKFYFEEPSLFGKAVIEETTLGKGKAFIDVYETQKIKGTGIIPSALKKLGFETKTFVEKQTYKYDVLGNIPFEQKSDISIMSAEIQQPKLEVSTLKLGKGGKGEYFLAESEQFKALVSPTTVFETPERPLPTFHIEKMRKALEIGGIKITEMGGKPVDYFQLGKAKPETVRLSFAKEEKWFPKKERLVYGDITPPLVDVFAKNIFGKIRGQIGALKRMDFKMDFKKLQLKKIVSFKELFPKGLPKDIIAKYAELSSLPEETVVSIFRETKFTAVPKKTKGYVGAYSEPIVKLGEKYTREPLIKIKLGESKLETKYTALHELVHTLQRGGIIVKKTGGIEGQLFPTTFSERSAYGFELWSGGKVKMESGKPLIPKNELIAVGVEPQKSIIEQRFLSSQDIKLLGQTETAYTGLVKEKTVGRFFEKPVAGKLKAVARADLFGKTLAEDAKKQQKYVADVFYSLMEAKAVKGAIGKRYANAGSMKLGDFLSKAQLKEEMGKGGLSTISLKQWESMVSPKEIAVTVPTRQAALTSIAMKKAATKLSEAQPSQETFYYRRQPSQELIEEEFEYQPTGVGIGTKIEFVPMYAQKNIYPEMIKTGVRTRIIPIISEKIGLGEKTKLFTEPKEMLGEKVTLGEKIRLGEKTKIIPIQKIAIAQRITLAQKQKLAELTKLIPATPIPPTPTIKTPIIILPKGAGLMPKALQVFEKGFEVFAKRQGKWFTLSKQPLSKTAALSLGAKWADITAGASFKIAPTKAPAVSSPLTDWQRLAYRFYQGKKGAFVEKTGYRISTGGEKQEITYKGIAASKGKRMQKKLFGKTKTMRRWGF